jgi:hypothetical protein
MNTTIHDIQSIKMTEAKKLDNLGNDFWIRHLFIKTDMGEITLTITSTSKDKLEITSY